jgi:hypothetical protein
VKILLNAEPVDLGALKASFAVREQSELDTAPMPSSLSRIIFSISASVNLGTILSLRGLPFGFHPLRLGSGGSSGDSKSCSDSGINIFSISACISSICPINNASLFSFFLPLVTTY